MALNIKNREVDRLADEVAGRTHVSKTEAVRQALATRLATLERTGPTGRGGRLRSFLEHDVWPYLPEELLGTKVTREERERILGLGEAGV